MKKFLPVFLFLVGIGVLVGVYFVVIKGREEEEVVDDEAALIEVPLNKRPVVSLTPKPDGHWLIMRIEKIVIDAETLDYELLYKLPDGRTQGVPGTVDIKPGDVIENELLLGSESSGKYRYDEGVEQGTLTLRFRNAKGKLVAKFSTEFELSSGTKELTSNDGRFSYTFDETPAEDFFVVMDTFGIFGEFADIESGPYGVFSSSSLNSRGEVRIEGDVAYQWDGEEWVKLEDSRTSDTGIFVSSTGQ